MHDMKGFGRKNNYILVAIPLLMVAVLWEIFSVKKLEPAHIAQKIYRVFETKEKIINHDINVILNKIINSDGTKTIWQLLDPANYKNDNTYVCVLNEDKLIFWSSSLIAFPQEIITQADTTQLMHLPTGWFYVYSKTYGDFTVKGFIMIKREFPYKNRYIQSTFPKDFNLPDDDTVKAEYQKEGINILKPDGKFLFSVVPSGTNQMVKNNLFLISIYFLFIFLLLAQVSSWLKQNPEKLGTVSRFLISFGTAVLIYIFLNRIRIPYAFYRSELFSPNKFAYSGWLSSLGEYFLVSSLMFYFAISFYNFFRSGDLSGKGYHIVKNFALLFAGFYFTFSLFLLKILILNSNITLTFFSHLTFSSANIFAFFFVALHTLGLVLILLRIKEEYGKGRREKGEWETGIRRIPKLWDFQPVCFLRSAFSLFRSVCRFADGRGFSKSHFQSVWN